MSKISSVPTLDEFREALKTRGLKATGQRIAVHEAMLELGHASADMVTERIALKGTTKVTVASVYNILSQLALMGIYKHRLSANNKMYFDVNTSRHAHLYDVYNNEYKDVMDDELMDVVEERLKRRRFRGYKVDAVDIQIICHPSHRKAPLSF